MKMPTLEIVTLSLAVVITVVAIGVAAPWPTPSKVISITPAKVKYANAKDRPPATHSILKRPVGNVKYSPRKIIMVISGKRTYHIRSDAVVALYDNGQTTIVYLSSGDSITVLGRNDILDQLGW